uniref:Odorant receptor n=1 Tax=Ceracris kiangsu TaxID=227354 RepID=A0A6M6DQB5_CERKI|nr:odorant receptor 67 [Ceracris kiangsu]
MQVSGPRHLSMEQHSRDGSSVGQREDVGRLLGLGAWGLRALGIWAGPEPATTRWGRAGPTLLLTALFAASATAQLGRERLDDLEHLGEQIFVSTTLTVTSMRIMYFMAYRLRMQRLANLLLEARRRFPEQGAAIRKRFQRRATRMCIGFQMTATVPLAMWVLNPVLAAAMTSPPPRGLNASASASAAAAVRQTPLSLWLPVDDQRSPGYELVFALEGFLIVFTGMASLFLDMFFIVHIIHITAELNVLNDNLAAIRVGAVRGGSSSISNTGSMRRSFNRPDKFAKLNTSTSVISRIDSDEYSHLVEAIRHHQTVMRYVQELENAMSQPLYILLSTNMVNMCLHMFTFMTLLQRNIEPASMMKFMFTFPAYLYQTGTYCIFGQAIIDQSERLVSSAGSCGWPECAPDFRRMLLVLMEQASRPLCIRVGKLVTLSRNTFLQLLKDTYTMFNMLFQLQGDK